MSTANTACLPLAELPTRARDAGDVVEVAKPGPAFTSVPLKPLRSAASQALDPLVPLRWSVPVPRLATNNVGVLGFAITAVPPLVVV